MKSWNLIFAVLIAFVCSSVMNIAKANTQQNTQLTKQNTIHKSPNDTRSYKTLTLSNGMQVLLASDASLSQSAVSLTVGVGSYQDPKSQPGLAHYLEHMIFMGSSKYPQPDALQTLVKANNGVINAMTEAQQTSYFFKIANNQFENALAMLSASLQAPLFKQELAKKELKAIDAEWSAKKESDRYAMYRTNVLTANVNHPMHAFLSGNLTTLKDKANSNLHADLINFYHQYYSANIMKLAIVGNKSLTELAALAKKYFAPITNNNLSRPVITTASFTDKALQKQIYLKTKVKTDSLVLQFPLANNSADWKNKPNMFVQYLLSSEEDGALIPSLRKAGLIESMQATFNPTTYGLDGTVFILC